MQHAGTPSILGLSGLKLLLVAPLENQEETEKGRMRGRQVKKVGLQKELNGLEQEQTKKKKRVLLKADIMHPWCFKEVFLVLSSHSNHFEGLYNPSESPPKNPPETVAGSVAPSRHTC